MIGLQIGAFILEMTMVVWFIRCKRIIKEGNRKMRGIKKIIIGVATVLLLNLMYLLFYDGNIFPANAGTVKG